MEQNKIDNPFTWVLNDGIGCQPNLAILFMGFQIIMRQTKVNISK
jgi:hypothetical protein